MPNRPSEEKAFDIEAVFEPNDYLYFYSDFLTKERTEKEVEYLINVLDLEKSMKILDLACGHGRHANRLAELGYRVTGVDITPGFLDIAKKDAHERGVTVTYLQQDMRDINFTEEFDIVLLLYTAFGYFNDEENFKVLQNIAKALKPEGMLCFDAPNRDNILKRMHPFHVDEKGDDLMIERYTFDSLTGKSYNRRIVIRNGIRKDKFIALRLYNPSELKSLLRSAGFEIHQLYGYWDDNPPTFDSSGIVYIAKRK